MTRTLLLGILCVIAASAASYASQLYGFSFKKSLGVDDLYVLVFLVLVTIGLVFLSKRKSSN